MIKIEKTDVYGWEAAIRGMRNPMNSWEMSDTSFCPDVDGFEIGYNDHNLMMKLAKGGSVHAKYRRMIIVTADITAPLYWWKEFDTYKIGTVANSCSTMHKIHAKEFDMEDFSYEHLRLSGRKMLQYTIDVLNAEREAYIGHLKGDKQCWYSMIQLLPSSYNQKRTVLMNYEMLSNAYRWRKDHKLDEWHDFCDWICELPYNEIIIGEEGAMCE